MLDTVSLRIKYPAFRVTKPELFYPELKIRRKEEIPAGLDIKRLFQKYVQNANASDRESGTYKPCLTVYRRYEDADLHHYLHIELSIPKMLYGNNLQELRDQDFLRTVSTLKEKLAVMGIEISEEAIKIAPINKAHFSKNLLLPYPMTVREVLAELKKADVGKRMEVNTREYRNDGESLYFYTTAHNTIFYDKVKDIGKTKNISVDKNKTPQERTLLQERLSMGEQILRMEVRFNGKRAVESFVSKLLSEKTEYVSFEMIFREEFCKKALFKSWRDIVDRPANQLALKMSMTPGDVLSVLILRGQSRKSNVHSLNRALISFGLYSLINQFGLKTVKNKLETAWGKKSCGVRLDQKIKEAAILLEEIPDNQQIQTVESGLEKFKRFDFANHED